jgi:hypothetical protein
MQIKNNATGEVFDVTGAVNKLVVCYSCADAQGATFTIDFDEGTVLNDDFELIA